MDDFLDCKGTETIEECPICGQLPIPEELQPEAGTHAFTIIYKCSTEIDFPIGYDGAVFGATCDGKIKRFDLSALLRDSNVQISN